MTMRRLFAVLFLSAVLAAPALAQFTSIVIPAGSDADKDITAIGNETDAQKKIALLKDFVQKYASDKMALAYGYQALAQQYQAAGDGAAALDAAEKSFAAVPGNLEIATTAVSTAQTAKNDAKVFEYAIKGAQLIHTAAAGQEAQYQQQLEFFETSAYNTISSEQDAKKRMADIDQFTPVFPKSRYMKPVMQFAMYSLQQMNQPAKMAEFGEKVLAANPDDLPTLVLLANAFADEQSAAQQARAEKYARRAIELAKPDPNNQQETTTAALAHAALGRVLIRQQKPLPGINELKLAEPGLKTDPDSQAMVLYWLGVGYGNVGKLPEAKAVLGEAIKIPGPYQQPSRELLEKVNAVKPKPRAR